VTTFRALKRKWMKDPNFRREFDALEEEFALVIEIAKARQRARLGWNEVARRMKAARRTIAKLENGRRLSTRTLGRFAKVTGHRLKISFEPVKVNRGSPHERSDMRDKLRVQKYRPFRQKRSQGQTKHSK
jgi:transcriptional regulator with XRE-family HTH domain